MKGRFLKLDQVAEQLGCHVETLRLRIRSGRLNAVRGPHGAYFIFGRWEQLAAGRSGLPRWKTRSCSGRLVEALHAIYGARPALAPVITRRRSR